MYGIFYVMDNKYIGDIREVEKDKWQCELWYNDLPYVSNIEDDPFSAFSNLRKSMGKLFACNCLPLGTLNMPSGLQHHLHSMIKDGSAKMFKI